MVSASAFTSPFIAAMRLERLGSPAAGREVTTAASSVSSRPVTSSRTRPSTPATGVRAARSRTSSSMPASRASRSLRPLSRLVRRPMVPSTARTMPAPATPAPSMDTPAGSQPRRRGGTSGGGSGGGSPDGAARSAAVSGSAEVADAASGRGAAWSAPSGGGPSGASVAVVRTGSGAISSAVRSRVRGRSRAAGTSPEAGGWSWSLLTGGSFCRFAVEMKRLVASLERRDPCRHPAPGCLHVARMARERYPGCCRGVTRGLDVSRTSERRERRSGTQGPRAGALQYGASRVYAGSRVSFRSAQARSLHSPGTRHSPPHPSPTSSSIAISSGRAAIRTAAAPAAASGAATWRERQ